MAEVKPKLGDDDFCQAPADADNGGLEGIDIKFEYDGAEPDYEGVIVQSGTTEASGGDRPTVHAPDPETPTRIPSDMEGIVAAAFAKPEELRSLKPPPTFFHGESLPPGATIIASPSQGVPLPTRAGIVANAAQRPSHITPIIGGSPERADSASGVADFAGVVPGPDQVIADVVDRYLEVTKETRTVFDLINDDPMFVKIRDIAQLFKDVGVNINDILGSVDIFRIRDTNLTSDEIFNICMLAFGDLARTILFELGVDASDGAEVVPEMALLASQKAMELDESGEIDSPFLKVNLSGIVNMCDRYAFRVGIDQNTVSYYARFLQSIING